MRGIVGILLVLVVGLGVSWLGVTNFVAARRSLSWPSVPGVIERSDAQAIEGCVAFSYTVAGVTRSATTVFLDDTGSTQDGRSASCAVDVVDEYQPGSIVNVYYDPANATSALLKPGPNGAIYMTLGVGGLFVLVGGSLLWRQVAARVRLPRLKRRSSVAVAGEAGGAAGAAGGVKSQVVTPSEVVAIHGARFAAATLASNVSLLGGGHASARELVQAELTAAVLAHEEAGTIRLEFASTPSRHLIIVPVGRRFPWPEPSTEARLDFPSREDASETIRRWVAQPSHVAWQRAAEKVHAQMVLRRAARVTQTGVKRQYALADQAVAAAATTGLPAVRALLQRCESQRPDVWRALSGAIDTAVEEGPADASVKSVFVSADPWYDESVTEVRAVPGLALAGTAGVDWRQGRPGLVVLWGVVAATTYVAPPEGRIALAVALALSALIFGAARTWLRGAAGKAGARWPRLQALLDAVFAHDWLQSALAVVPLMALFILVIGTVDDPRGTALAIAGALMGVMWLLRKRAGMAITRHVGGVSQSVPAVAGATTPTVSEPASPSADVPFDITIVRATDLPDVSDHMRDRIQAIRQRGPELRRVYRRGVLIMAAGSTAVALAAWRLLGGFPSFTVFLFVVTLLVLSGARSENSILAPVFLIARYTWRHLRGGGAADRNRWEREIMPIRPVVTPLLGLGWSVFTLLRAFSYGGGTLAGWGLAGVSVVIVVSVAVWRWRRTKMLENRYPAYPPLSLLTLRVFSSPSHDRFVELLDLWHWFGPLYRLDGPDTAGEKSSDVLAYVTGRVDKAVTEDHVELAEAVRHFVSTRDEQLRFRFNALQCNDRMWKAALEQMLARADVVVMDLSSLTAHNRGCAHEIGKLVNEVPLERVVLLINDETDLNMLRRLLADATAGQAPGGPSRTLRLFDLGTQPRRRENESVYDWQRRAAVPIDADRLIGLLGDAACSKAPAQTPLTVRWARPGYHRAPVA